MKGRKLLWVVPVALIFGACAQQTTKETAKGLDRIHFDFDKSFIKTEFEPVLKGNANWMQKHTKKAVVIEGHCDERGTNEYNIALGDRRANSAKNYVANLGVAADRLSTISYGEERALENCHNESCWWKNRRADFLAK